MKKGDGERGWRQGMETWDRERGCRERGCRERGDDKGRRFCWRAMAMKRRDYN